MWHRIVRMSIKSVPAEGLSCAQHLSTRLWQWRGKTDRQNTSSGHGHYVCNWCIIGHLFVHDWGSGMNPKGGETPIWQIVQYKKLWKHHVFNQKSKGNLSSLQPAMVELSVLMSSKSHSERNVQQGKKIVCVIVKPEPAFVVYWAVVPDLALKTTKNKKCYR